MANTATKKSVLRLKMGGGFYGYRVTPVLVNYDTPGQDLEISKAANQSIFLLGWECVSSTSFKPILKSDSTTLIRYELASNSGRVESLCLSSPRLICNTEAGEGLNFNCDVALPPFLMYIAEV